VILVLAQAIMTMMLVVVAVDSLNRITSNERYMYQYQFRAVADVGRAKNDAATLKGIALRIESDPLKAFSCRYAGTTVQVWRALTLKSSI
jgi:hypothetical protein